MGPDPTFVGKTVKRTREPYAWSIAECDSCGDSPVPAVHVWCERDGKKRNANLCATCIAEAAHVVHCAQVAQAGRPREGQGV